MIRTSRDEHRAVLVLKGMLGWYRALAEHGSQLPDLGAHSWYVDVFSKPVGWLGAPGARDKPAFGSQGINATTLKGT